MRAPVPAQRGLKLGPRQASPVRLEPAARLAEKRRSQEQVVPAGASAAGLRRWLRLAARAGPLAIAERAAAPRQLSGPAARSELPAPGPSLPERRAAELRAQPAGRHLPWAPAQLVAVPVSGKHQPQVLGSRVAALARDSRPPPERPHPAALLPALPRSRLPPQPIELAELRVLSPSYAPWQRVWPLAAPECGPGCERADAVPFERRLGVGNERLRPIGLLAPPVWPREALNPARAD
jgi:hypothetical protein